MLAAPVSLHVGKHSALVSPEVILGAEEEDGKLSDLMAKVLDVGGYVSRVVDLCRPPSEEKQQHELHCAFRAKHAWKQRAEHFLSPVCS